MAIITLTTDWGEKDYYIGTVKGSILSLMPNVTIVDISHKINHFDIEPASFVIKNCYKSFPKGTIHIIGVNSEASIETPHVLICYQGYYFIGADNGIFSLIFDEKPEKIILADAYSDFGNFEKAFELYKELLNESQNIRILINAFHCLIASEKLAEAKFFHLLFQDYAEENEQYQKNLDVLNKQIEEILNWATENGLKNNEDLIKEKGETNQAYVIDFHLKTFEEIKDDDINLLMELFARENERRIYRLKDRVFQLLVKKESEIPDFSFFFNSPNIEKL